MAQEQSAPTRTFFHRTNTLAARMGLAIQDLPDFIKVSRRTLFECRSADSAVTGKTWAKLEEAEARAKVAGFWKDQDSDLSVSKGNPNELKTVSMAESEKTFAVRDDPAGNDPEDGGKVAELERRLAHQELRMEALERMLAAAIDLSRLRNDNQPKR